MQPEFQVRRDGDLLSIQGRGNWTITEIDRIDKALANAVDRTCAGMDTKRVHYDLADVERMDTSGAYLLTRHIRCFENAPIEVDGTDAQRTLLNTVIRAQMGRAPQEPRQWFDALARVGKGVDRAWAETVSTLAFLGHFAVDMARAIASPRRFRWKSIVAQIETVGLDAAPIIMVLSFFIGAVIAFMGANLLANFGAQLFMVDLVGVTVLREFAVLITAIMLAGRSASSFTAQIGAMRMRQEIDAMEVIGLDAFRALVIPRAVACVVSAPILTFLAMLSGLGGGLLVAWLGPTDIPPVLFVSRLNEAVSPNNFWVGIVKAPIFAIIIAIIGCRQGMSVAGSVTSLGARTTSSVVQAIFAVIVVDAIFAVVFLTMDV